MANKRIDLNTKVAVMQACLTLEHVNEVLETYGVSERSIWYWYRRIIEHLPDILDNRMPGPTSRERKASPFLPDESPPQACSS